MDETLDDGGSPWTTDIPANTSTTDTPGSVHGVDTLIVIIWATGGALLVTLIILMVCILKSHKKSRRERTNLPIGRGNPRHGGVNHGFTGTNYDDIWTWIPVVTDSQARCPAQINPSARENSSNQQSVSNQQRTLLNNLRLPSYNEAVRINAQSSNMTNQNRTNQTPHQNTNHVTSARSAAIVPNRTETRTQPSAPQIRPNTFNRSLDHHYETIPHDRIITSRNASHPSATNNVTSVNVTSSSGAPIQHTTASRISIDQVSRSRNTRLPPVPSLQSPGQDRRGVVPSGTRIISGNVGHRAESRQVGVTTGSIYPLVMDNITSRPGTSFQHSESSVFMYCGNNGTPADIHKHTACCIRGTNYAN